MAVSATRYSRVSIGWASSDQSLADVDAGDTGATFSVNGPAVFDDAVTITGALTQTGALTIGSAGAAVTEISTATAAVDFGAVAAHDSSSVTVGLSGAAVGDAVVVSPNSNWSGAYYDLDLQGQVTAADVVTIAARNSTATAVNPDETVMRVTAIGFGSFV